MADTQFAKIDPEHGGITAYSVWTAGGIHCGYVEQFPAERFRDHYWMAWRTGHRPVLCQACGGPRRFPTRTLATAALLPPPPRRPFVVGQDGAVTVVLARDADEALLGAARREFTVRPATEQDERQVRARRAAQEPPAFVLVTTGTGPSTVHRASCVRAQHRPHPEPVPHEHLAATIARHRACGACHPEREDG